MKKYITTAFYFVFIPSTKGVIYCSGVNIDRFLPITKGRHKAMSNPAIRGLQNLNLELRTMAINVGATPFTEQRKECIGVVSKEAVWYTESIFFSGLPEHEIERFLSYAVVELIRKIDKALMLKAKLPTTPLTEEQMEQFIDSLCERYAQK